MNGVENLLLLPLKLYLILKPKILAIRTRIPNTVGAVGKAGQCLAILVR